MKLSLSEIRRNYGAMALEEAHMPANPIDQCRLWLDAAIQAEVPDPTAMLLSTVDQAGQPDARIVLLKDLQSEGFVFYSDYASHKGEQLAQDPRAALTFYWPVLSRQLRIRGKVSQVPAEMSDTYFASRPYLSQLSACASQQSEVIASRAELETRIEQLKKRHPEGTLSRPPNWGGYLIAPESIEFWQGRDNRLHDRILYTLQHADAWQRVRLSP